MIKIIKKYQNQLLVSLFLIIGAFLRFHHIGLRTFWLDEASSANLLNYSLSELYSKILATGNYPAYIYLLKLWSYFFGDSELALRSFSTFLGLLSIVAIYKFGTYLFNNKVGLWASFLLSVNFFNIFYSIQARQYSLVCLLSILSYYYFLKNKDKIKLKYSFFLYNLYQSRFLFSSLVYFSFLFSTSVFILLLF